MRQVQWYDVGNPILNTWLMYHTQSHPSRFQWEDRLFHAHYFVDRTPDLPFAMLQAALEQAMPLDRLWYLYRDIVRDMVRGFACSVVVVVVVVSHTLCCTCRQNHEKRHGERTGCV